MLVSWIIRIARVLEGQTVLVETVLVETVLVETVLVETVLVETVLVELTHSLTHPSM